jgi:hypothetical protein
MMPASDQFTERLVVPTHFLRIPNCGQCVPKQGDRSHSRRQVNIGRRAMLDADEAEVRSVSSDILDR